MKRLITAGATDQTVYLFIQDSASTTGGGKTGLAYNTASLVCYYVRDLAAAAALTLATQTVTGAHSDGGFVEVDATNTPGLYRLDLSDAVCAAGVSNVVLMLKGASGMVPLPLEIQLAGGQIATVTNIVTANATQFAGQTITASGGVTIPAATLASTTNITAATGIDITHILGTAIATPATAGVLDVNTKNAGNVAWASGAIVAGAIDTGAITNAKFAAGAIDAAAIAPDAIGASELATGAVSEIVSAVWAAQKSDNQVEGSFGENLGVQQTSGADTAGMVWNRARLDYVNANTFGEALQQIVLGAAGIRTAVGLATANLDTQLTAIDDAVDTEVAAIYSRLGAPAGASMSADIAAVKAETALIQAKTTNLPAAPASTTNITQATGIDITKILGTAISTPATAGMLDVNIVNIGGSAADLGATPGMLDVRLAEVSLGGGIQLRANLGLATADLDTQLAALPTAAEAGAATWEELRASHVAAGSFGEAVANVAGSVGGNVDGNVAGSVGSVVGAVGSVTGLTAANLDVAVSTRLADANTQSQVRAALGVVSANLDAQLGAIDDLIDTEVAAIYSRLGAPAGASVSADIAAVKAETATINTATGATAIRTAVGLASANLDTQLGAIDDLLDTEIAAIKAKTDLIPAAPASTTNITAAAGIALSAGERTTLANAILDVADGATTNYTLREALEVMLAVLAGKLSGAATATITIRDVNDTKNVVVATTDASGNRTAVTVTP